MPPSAWWLLLLLASLARCRAENCSLLPPPCHAPLGLQSGQLADSRLTASSAYSAAVGAGRGRLAGEEGGGAWCPRPIITNTSREWLQVELAEPHRLTGLVVQGRWDRGLGREWAEQVRLEAWQPGLGWQLAGGPHQANVDTFSPVLVELGGLTTTRLRVLPVSRYPRTVCLRIELCRRPASQQFPQFAHDKPGGLPTRSEQRPGATRAVGGEQEKHAMTAVIGVLVSIILILATTILYILPRNHSAARQVQRQQ